MSIPLLTLMTSFLLLSNPGGQSGTALGIHFRAAQQTNAPESLELTEARAQSNSAVKLYQQGKYKEALNPAKRALEIRERTLSADDKLVLEALRDLAAISLALRKYKDAEALYQRVLAGQEKQFGAESIDVAETLNILARLHYAKGKVDQAKEEYARALAIEEKSTGADSHQVAQTLFQLAELYQSQADLEKAHSLYQRLMAFDEKLELEGNTTVGDARYRFHCLLQKMNKHEDARELIQRKKPVVEPQGPPRVNEGGILNGRAITLQKPRLSDKAWAAGASGIVIVIVTINEEGKIMRACAVKGHPLLWEAAEHAARASEFAPTILNGNPVKVTGAISYNFVR